MMYNALRNEIYFRLYSISKYMYIEHKWQIKVRSRSKSEEEQTPCMVNVAHPSPK